MESRNAQKQALKDLLHSLSCIRDVGFWRLESSLINSRIYIVFTCGRAGLYVGLVVIIIRQRMHFFGQPLKYWFLLTSWTFGHHGHLDFMDIWASWIFGCSYRTGDRTNIGQLLDKCPLFVQLLPNFCQSFVHVQVLSKYFWTIIGQQLDKCLSSFCPIFTWRHQLDLFQFDKWVIKKVLMPQVLEDFSLNQNFE